MQHDRAPASGTEADIAAAAPTPLVRLAGGALLFGSLLTLLVAAQLLAMARVRGVGSALLYAMIALGVLGVVSGWSFLRARRWAARAGVGTAATLAAVDLAWVVWSFSHYFFSLLALMALGTAAIATALTAIALRDCERVAAARARLTSAGLDMGM